ncbi:hypothetical protein [Dehalogenimonas etheniformans]|uniref:Uncharacterized protein n=1 Tax=Dehalogenimonas etheniformans TaxID=1536648 RepID=A0A2P5P8G5_9CHLR|nr:hypothetical protein [Dehalogenimonas etheniformans]PPD58581.1 hypothetical protein JP09_001475 [Dehalogenimonas etheniformans]QNT76655.1 hypothetical protein HX448_08145 [Dehalogenimonas etheniformans]
MKLLSKFGRSFITLKRLLGAGGIAAAGLFILTLTPISAAELPSSYEPEHWQSSGPGTKTIDSSTGGTEGLTFTYLLRSAPFS